MTIRAMAFGVAILALGSAVSAQDWPVWRGPNRNGIAAEQEDLPVSWTATRNVIWKMPVPGRGASSPTITEDRIFLTTADEDRQIQSVVAFDQTSGQQLWKTDVNQGGFPAKIHRKNTHATCTVASDGERLFVSFFNRKVIHVTALDLDGKQLWQKTAGAYTPVRYQYGYAPSPTVYKSFVLIAVDFDGDAFVAALDCSTGRVVWRTPRPAKSNFALPIIARIAGRDQLLIGGSDLIASYDPTSGKELWKTEATTETTCGTVVWTDNLVFGSGGFPTRGTFAVRADGSGQVVWKNNKSCYEQSMLAHEDYVYAVDDGGVAHCWRAEDGSEMWSVRLGGRVSSSPVLAGGNIYVSNEKGTTYVFEANPHEFKEIARNRLGNEAFATPTICGNRIYLRVADTVNKRRQEFLYCIGKR